MGGAKIPGILVEFPTGVVNEEYGKEEGKETDGSQAVAQRMVKEAERKILKRLRHIGDDTIEEEDDQEKEEDNVARDQEMDDEVNKVACIGQEI